jgi:hypothetical protein
MNSKSSMMKALGVYVAVSWAIIQVIDVLTQNLGLPGWAFSYALILVAIGFPIVGVTAFLNGLKVRHGKAGEEREGARKVFRWRNALGGGVAAFVLFGITMAGYWGMWALGVGPLGSLIAKGVLEENDLVLLSTFRNETSDPQLASVVTGTLRVDLERSNSIRLVPETYLRNVLRRMGRDSIRSVGPDLAREAAIREGIKAVIEGEVAALGPSFVLTARIVDPESGSSFASFRETADTDADLIDALDRLSASVRERAGESLRSIGAGEPLAAVTTESLTALKRYTEALRVEEEGDPLRAPRRGPGGGQRLRHGAPEARGRPRESGGIRAAGRTRGQRLPVPPPVGRNRAPPGRRVLPPNRGRPGSHGAGIRSRAAPGPE